MTPERMAGVVARWARCYTRGLPEPVARRRIEELDADLHDHIAHERAQGTAEGRIALGIASRMARGLAADAAWRGQNRKELTTMRKPVFRVTLVTALVLLVPFIGMTAGDGTDWGVMDFVLAAVLLGGAGMLLELAVSRPRSPVFRIVAVGVGAAAMVAGEADDAPGLVGFGLLLVAGAIALSLRRPQRSS